MGSTGAGSRTRSGTAAPASTGRSASRTTETTAAIKTRPAIRAVFTRRVWDRCDAGARWRASVDRDPEGSVPHRDACRCASDLDLLDDPEMNRIDSRHGAVRTRHPHGTVADGDPVRLCPDRHRSTDRAGPGVDRPHAVRDGLRNPDIRLAVCDLAGGEAERDMDDRAAGVGVQLEEPGLVGEPHRAAADRDPLAADAAAKEDGEPARLHPQGG